MTRSHHTKSLSYLDRPLKLNPWFITGFTDGEGSFTLSIRDIDNDTKKARILYAFQIGLHKKYEGILRSIQYTRPISYNSPIALSSILSLNSTHNIGLLSFKQTPIRKYSTSTSFNTDLLSDEEFYEWLRGFIPLLSYSFDKRGLLRCRWRRLFLYQKKFKPK